MHFNRFTCSALAVALLFSIAAHATDETGTMVRDIAYGPAQENRLDVCRPGDASAEKPGVLLIHGGGWTKGTKEYMKSRCRALAARGIVAATLDYRLAQMGRPATYWPAQLSDVQLAMRWMRAHAKDYGMNPNRLCADGDSAGGHLAVFLGVAPPVVQDGNAGLYPDYSSAANCVVDNFGMTDFTDPHAMPGANTTLFGGDTLEKNPEAYAKASPLPLVSAHSAPMLIVHGYDDNVIPFSQSLRLFQALTAQHVPAEFAGHPGGHRFGFSPEQMKRIDAIETDYLLTH